MTTLIIRSILVLGTLLSVLGLTPSSPGSLALEPSYSYLTFDASLANSTSTLGFANTSMFIMARKYAGSSEYVWLERNLSDPQRTTYQVVTSYITPICQKRSYSSKTAFSLPDYQVHGFVVDNNDLKHVVATYLPTNDLYVLTVGVAFSTSASSNVDYKFVVSERKMIPKTVALQPDIQVKSMDSEALPDSTAKGKRILISGTTVSTPEHAFLCIFNTLYNVTEFLWEQSADDITRERVKSVEVDANNAQVLLITDRYSSQPFEPTCSSSAGSTYGMRHVAIRAFGLERKVLMWMKLFGHEGYDNFYGGSGISGNYLVLAFSTNKSHSSSSPEAPSDLEFMLVRTDSGYSTSTSCLMVLTSAQSPLSMIELIVTADHGIYALLSVPAGSVTYAKTAAQYTFAAERSYALLLFELDAISTLSVPTMNLIDVRSIDAANSSFGGYNLTRMLMYYPSGLYGHGVPEVLLIGHLDPQEKTGLLIFSFSAETCSIGSSILASHNPFVTDQGCSGAGCLRCLAGNTGKCVDCVADTHFLGDRFICTASACPSGHFYVPSTRTCQRCHYSCLTCAGPLQTQCVTCDPALFRTINLYSGECRCAQYSSNGLCVAACATGQSALSGTLTTCRDRCPAHTFNFADYGSSTVQPVSGPLTVSEGTDSLEFVSASTSSCLMLPGPTGAVSVPEQFTLSFWIYPQAGWTAGTKALLWAFNAVSVMCDVSGGVYTAKLILHTSTGDVTPVSSSSYAVLTTGKWNFIAVSVKKTSTSYEAFLYVTVKGTTAGGDGARSASTTGTLQYPDYANQILVGCAGSRAPDGTVTLTQGVDFSGYVRELVYQARFYERENVDYNKGLAYSKCLEVYKGVLAYWKFDEIAAVAGGYELKDSSRFAKSTTISSSGVPGKKTLTPDLPLCAAIWEALGTCVDLFAASNYPEFSFDLQNFAVSEIAARINLNDKALLSKLVREGDKLVYTFGDCKTGTALNEAKISLQTDGSVKIESGKAIPVSAMGRHVNICYRSPVLDTTLLLGRTYFVVVPEQIFPSHGASERSATVPLAFRILGGDQSAFDLLTLVNIEQDTPLAIADTIPIDESLSTYAIYSASKLANGNFSNIATAALDRGTYTVAWRPGYMYQTVGSGLVRYKNLFITWSMQDVPKAKFPAVVGVPNTYKNTVLFKGELLYLDLVGVGQHDGDEIILCYTGCHYSNRVGPTFARVNSRYPPLWFGESAGVYNLLDNSAYDRVYVCWRSSARAAVYQPDDDAWYAVLDYQKLNTAAYIIINSLTDNSDLPEIIATNPPQAAPVLHPGESIWFQFGKCSAMKAKPTMYGTTPGKVRILHMTYSAYDHSSYTTEVVWEQQFASVADFSSSVLTVGKLSGDYSTCNYTIQDLPLALLQPGHDYMLGIYSRSFVTSTGKYLFGALSPDILQYKFVFTFQEATFTPIYRQILPTETEILITGINLGDLTVPGNGFSDTRRLFGIIVTPVVTPACSSLTASYVSVSRFQNPSNSIKLTGVSMSTCNGTLELDMKLIKISDYTDSGTPLWYYTSTFQRLSIGFIGCHYSCKTCNGTEYNNCLTCNASTALGYLYKGQCLTQCEEDFPHAEIVFASGTTTIEYYRCVKRCSPGYYADATLGYCLQCHAQCRTCTSGNPMSCVDCKGTAVGMTDGTLDYNNTFHEAYLFQNMCMTSCPNIVNDFVPEQKLVDYDNYTRKCVIKALPSGSHPISVSVQPIMYPQRINIKRSIYLRALLNDVTSNFTGISWTAHPAEDTAASGFTSSDKRTFDTYTEDNVNSTIAALNMNAFNYKSDTDIMRIIVKAWTSDSINFAIFELYGNRPPELDDDDVTFTPTSGYTTDSYMSITISSVEDADDYFQLLKFKVMLIPRSLVLPDSYKSTTADTALQLLAQLTAKTITIYPSTLALSIINGAVTLSNIYIPPLIDGPQLINDEILTSKVSCDVLLYAEDRYMGVTKTKFTINVTETYAPSARAQTLSALRQTVLAASINASMTWSLALRVAHTFAVTNPEPRTYYMAYQTCTKDSQCGGHGKCATSGGWSECVCDKGYLGRACDWTKGELSMVQDISAAVITFMNATILKQFNESLEENPGYTAGDTNALDQTANVLIGMLRSPEAVEVKYMSTVVQLFDYLTRLNQVTGARLLDFEKTNILLAIDSIIKFVYHNLRPSMHIFYLLGESRKTKDIEIAANYTARREEMARLVLTMRNGLYKFANAISTAQYPGDAPYFVELDTFKLLVTAVQESTLFANLGGSLAMQLDSSSGYFKLPTTILESVRSRVSYNGEFKVRAVKWTDNPYVFSDYHAEVSTPVFSLAVLDSNGEVLRLNLSDPIVFFMPLTNATKYFPADKLKCKYFNDLMRANVTRSVVKKVNVNELNMTDSQKAQLYPEWQPRLYSTFDLIVETNEYETAEADYPEFVDSPGITSYGNVMRVGEYVDTVPCAAYHLSEVAAVVQRRQSMYVAQRHTEFYNTFDPLATINMTVGMYVCIIMCVLFVASMFIVWYADTILVPKLERIISLHRNEYSDKEIDANLTGVDLEKAVACNNNSNISLVVKAEENRRPEDSVENVAKPEEGDPRPNESNISAKSAGSEGSNGQENLESEKAKSGNDESSCNSEGEGSGSGSAEEEVKMEGGGVVRVKRRRKKNLRKHRHYAKPTDAASTGNDGVTQEDLKKKTTMNSMVSQPQTKVADTKENDTSMNHTTTKEMTSTVGILHATTGKLESTGEGSAEKRFADVKAKEIRKKDKDSHQIEDIFSKEYIARREEEQFKPVQLYISANPILNMCLRTNSVFTRPMRCVLLFSYLYFVLFWSALLLTSSINSLDHSEDTKKVGSLIANDIWVMVFAPILTNVIMFLVGGIFKLNEFHIRNAKTTRQYKYHMNDLIRHRKLRYLLGYSIIGLAFIGTNYYLCKFSALYGWKSSLEWIWVSLIALFVDLVIFDWTLAFAQHGLYGTWKDLALRFQRLRALKQAELQE